MSSFSFFTALFVMFSSWCWAGNLKAFETDLCTGYAEGTWSQKQLWAHCCVEHDLYFWAGGSKKDRLAADNRLKTCVASTGAQFHSQMIYLGVKMGSFSPIKIKDKQWGNGWINQREPGALTQAETHQIIEMIEWEDFPISSALKTTFRHQLLSRLEQL